MNVAEADRGGRGPSGEQVVRRIEAGVLTSLFMALVSLGLIQIVGRNLAGESWTWVDGAMRAGLLWLVMAGGVVAAGRLSHIRIRLLEHYLPDAVVNWLRRVVFAATAMVCLALTWAGLDIVALEYEFRTVAFLSVPNWMVQLAVPVGFGMMAARFLAWSVSPPLRPGEG